MLEPSLSRPPRLVPVAQGAIELVGRSPAVSRVQELVRRLAPLEGGVLLTCEPGADAESVARELHGRGRPASAPWVPVACGDSDPAEVDRQLFGNVEGAGQSDLEAVSPQSRIVAARGGTLFLQDVTDLPAAVQARLARIARDGEVRVGGTATPTTVRLIASAPPSIDNDVRDHRFRPDLYRRLAVSRIDLPPLRDRAEDVPALAARLLDDVAAAGSDTGPGFTDAALALLAALSWPGNLAELRAVVDRVAADCGDRPIQIEQLLPALQLDRTSMAFSPAGTLRDARVRFERDYIAAVLQHHGWRMADAARTLGIQRPNLYRKARQLGIPVMRPNDQVKSS